MSKSAGTYRVKPHLWLITVIGVVVPQRLRADWRQEWEAELRYREMLLSEWERLDWRAKLDLLWRSLGAFWDALCIQRQRLEDEMFQDLRFGLRMLLKSPVFAPSAQKWLSTCFRCHSPVRGGGCVDCARRTTGAKSGRRRRRFISGSETGLWRVPLTSASCDSRCCSGQTLGTAQ